jgi:hypothetical protein
MNTEIDESDIQAMESHRHLILLIQLAAKRPPRIFDDLHPDVIRARIASLQSLLAEAGV